MHQTGMEGVSLRSSWERDLVLVEVHASPMIPFTIEKKYLYH
jgi:hypothetical protein